MTGASVNIKSIIMEENNVEMNEDFGEGWVKEVKTWDKEDIIRVLLRPALLQNKFALGILEDISDKQQANLSKVNDLITSFKVAGLHIS